MTAVALLVNHDGLYGYIGEMNAECPESPSTYGPDNA